MSQSVGKMCPTRTQAAFRSPSLLGLRMVYMKHPVFLAILIKIQIVMVSDEKYTNSVNIIYKMFLTLQEKNENE